MTGGDKCCWQVRKGDEAPSFVRNTLSGGLVCGWEGGERERQNGSWLGFWAKCSGGPFPFYIHILFKLIFSLRDRVATHRGWRTSVIQEGTDLLGQSWTNEVYIWKK